MHCQYKAKQTRRKALPMSPGRIQEWVQQKQEALALVAWVNDIAS
jgi:hypothetical protein